jgi:hypothetical protein
MECPKCHQQAITFMQWGQRKRAFRHTCPHCGEPLKANRATILWFIVAVLAMTLFTVGFWYFDREPSGDHPPGDGIILLPCLLAIGFAFCLVAWKRGGYVSRQQPTPPET